MARVSIPVWLVCSLLAGTGTRQAAVAEEAGSDRTRRDPGVSYLRGDDVPWDRIPVLDPALCEGQVPLEHFSWLPVFEQLGWGAVGERIDACLAEADARMEVPVAEWDLVLRLQSDEPGRLRVVGVEVTHRSTEASAAEGCLRSAYEGLEVIRDWTPSGRRVRIRWPARLISGAPAGVDPS